MIRGGHYERRQNKIRQKKTGQAVRGKDGGTSTRGGESGSQRCVPARGNCSGPAVPVAAEVFARGNQQSEGHQKGSEAKREPRGHGIEDGAREAIPGTSGDFHRAPGDEKKESLGLEGPLFGRHLTKDQREALRDFITEKSKDEPVVEICKHLQIHPRAYYRWKNNQLKPSHGGGGGRNKITPKEEKAIVNLAKKNPQWHCRRIGYRLERTAKAFVGKTTVARVMKAHGLNHPFERKPAKILIPPADMLLHEPWRKNLVWGMDWTWVNVDGKFMFLIVLLDWYSRKILSWGLYHKITQNEVVTLVTEAVALEEIDLLPEGAMKPFVVADHGSANTAAYTKHNIKIQGLTLWLSGIGRPTGNARTERLMGTLKREEINLQEQYANEPEAKQLIGNKIYDYNFHRPNQGNGGFAPNSVHHQGRAELTKRRKKARQKTRELRIKHWEQGKSPSNSLLT